MKLRTLYLVFLCTPLLGAPTLSSQPEDVEALQTFLGLSSSHRNSKHRVKVAVLAAGFAGMEPDQAERPFPPKYLPDSTQLITDYGTNGLGLRPNDTTGRRLAQLAWALVDYSDQVDFRLYNGNGLSNQRLAVEAMMTWEPHVVLSTEVFPTFGNFDGTGPLNRYIRALSQMGAVWIQSAGTVGGRVLNGKVDYQKGYRRSHELIVETDDTEIAITLSWDAFSPGRHFSGTNRDLDLELRDSNDKIIAHSRLRQVEGDPGDGETNLATEKLEVNLLRSEKPYKVCVVNSGGDLDRTNCYRLTLESEKQPYFDDATKKEVDPIRFTEKGFAGELGVPADNPFVLTVGSDHPFSATGPTWDGRTKPDMIFDGAEVNFTDKGALVGPQVGVAYLGAMVIALKGQIPELQEKHVRKILDWGQKSSTSNGGTRAKVSTRWDMPSMDKIKDLVRDNP